MKLLAVVVVLGGSFFALSEANAGLSRTILGDNCKINCTGFSNACGPKCKACFAKHSKSKQAYKACCSTKALLKKNAAICAPEEQAIADGEEENPDDQPADE